MANESDILLAMFQRVQALGLPTAYLGTKFNPPSSGQWLELIFLPNDNMASPVNANSTPMKRGIFRVNVCNRQNTGIIPLTITAESVKAAFPIASAIMPGIKVSAWPVIKETLTDDGIMRIPVTVEYAA